jgi:hypothetical protein
MLKYFDNVFRHISPYRIAVDLGLDIKSKGSDFYTKDKSGKFTVILRDSEFIDTSSHRAGSCVDLLVRVNGGSYREAVEYMFEHYYDRLDGIQAFSKELAISTLTSKLDTNHRLTEFLYGLAANNGQHATFNAELMFMSPIDTKRLKKYVFFAKYSEVLHILNLIYGEDEFEHDFKNRNYIILPYYKSYGRIGHLALYDTENDPTYIPVNSCDVSYLGLWSVLDAKASKSLIVSPRSMLYMLSSSRANGQFDDGYVSPHYESSSDTSGITFDKLVYRYTESDDLKNLHVVRRYVKDFTVTTSPIESGIRGKSHSWHSFAAAKILALAKTYKCFNAKISTLLKDLRLDETAINYTNKVLTDNGLKEVASHISKSGEIFEVVNIRGIDIRETKDGYFVKRKGDSTETPITNFSIKFSSSINYATSGEVYYRGKVWLGKDTSFNVIIPRAMILKINDLETHIIRSAPLGAMTPNIIDPTFLPHISAVLRKNMENIVKLEGCESIGFDAFKETYTTSLWKSNGNTISKNLKLIPHPDKEWTQSYQFDRPFIVESVGPMLTDSSAVILGIMVSYITRFYVSAPTPVTAVRDTQFSRVLLKFMMATLGQSKAMSIRPNRRKIPDNPIPEINGIPYYGYTTQTSNLLEFTEAPLLLLDPDSGIIIHQHTIQELSGIFHMVSNVIPRIASWLISTKGIDAANHIDDSVDRPNSHMLMSEGLDILKNVCGISYEFTTRYGLRLTQFLMSLRDLSTVARLDVASQKVRLNYRDSEISKKDVQHELACIDKDAQYTNTAYFELDVKAFSDYHKETMLIAPDLQVYIPKARKESNEIDIDSSRSELQLES